MTGIAIGGAPRLALEVRVVALITLCCLAGCHDAPTAPPDQTSDPETAVVVTSDITNFWHAYDAGGKDGSADAFAREYLAPASDGLKDFVQRRAITSASLAAMVRQYPRYFAAARTAMEGIASGRSIVDQVRADDRRLKTLYPDAIFPPVTLLVGRFSTGGTLGTNGLLIGSEFYVAGPNVPRDELGAFQRANVHAPDSLHFLIAHENIHAQQGPAGGIHSTGSTLLEQSVMEGGADFVAVLVSGGSINSAIYAWGLAHEHDVWTRFKTDMNGTSVSAWLYNQESSTADWPGDLGYFIGYRIAQSFYERQSDKAAAIRDIIGARDARALLSRSAYDP